MNVLAIGPNPAYQKSLELSEFTPHEVNRATSMRACAGGKGIHFARAINQLAPGTATIAQLLGGNTGQAVHDWCQEEANQIVTWTQAPTRTCTTVLCRKSNEMTELIEPTGALSDEEAASFRQQVLTACDEANAIGLCGTYPPELGESFYADAAKQNPQATVLLDGYRGVTNVLEGGHVNVLKINESELKQLTGEADVAKGAARCLAQWNLSWLGITAGPNKASLFGRQGSWSFNVPALANVANPIGAGDTVSSVFLLNLMLEQAPEEAFAYGLAAATASCQSMTGAQFTVEQADHVRSQIQIHQTSQVEVAS